MKCIECKWFADSGGHVERGKCRKPAPVVIKDGYEVGYADYLTVWPFVNGYDWCGDFEKKLIQLADIGLDQFNFTVRVQNCLASVGIETVDQLMVVLKSGRLRYIRNFGKTCLREVKRKLAEYQVGNDE